MKVLTMGTFDLFHIGHVAWLRRCRALSLGGEVIVGLNTDEFAARYKRMPTIAYADREAVVASCRYVDAVIPNDQPGGSAQGLIEAIAPDYIAAGWDWRDRDYLGQIGTTRAWLDEHHVAIVWLPYTDGVSTTELLARLR